MIHLKSCNENCKDCKDETCYYDLVWETPKRKYPFNKKELLPKEYLHRIREFRRRQVIEHYGGSPPKCSNCGNNCYEVLEIDHIKNNGNNHRKEIGDDLCYWLIKNNFPDGFQILCANCHTYKTKVGKLPQRTVIPV